MERGSDMKMHRQEDVFHVSFLTGGVLEYIGSQDIDIFLGSNCRNNGERELGKTREQGRAWDYGIVV